MSETSPMADRRYLPAAGKSWLLPLYDPLTRLIGAGAAHRKLAEQAELGSARRVLEIGCGTGNLVLLVKRMDPRLEVTGLDPDPRALARPGRKARRAKLALQLDRGFADQLPYPDGCFDRVLSSLMFHHLDAGQRVASLREVRRVLRPGRLPAPDGLRRREPSPARPDPAGPGTSHTPSRTTGTTGSPYCCARPGSATSLRLVSSPNTSAASPSTAPAAASPAAAAANPSCPPPTAMDPLPASTIEA